MRSEYHLFKKWTHRASVKLSDAHWRMRETYCSIFFYPRPEPILARIARQKKTYGGGVIDLGSERAEAKSHRFVCGA